MTIQVWGSAAALVAASLLLGYAVNALGFRCAAAAPAVGLGLLMIIGYTVIRITGEAVVPAVLLVVLTVAAAVVLVFRHRRLGFPRRISGAGIGAIGAGVVAALGAAVPFLANGHAGLLGVSLDNDTANHLLWAQALRSGATRNIYGLPDYYPLGPHALAAIVSTGTGARLDAGFDGLLIAGVVLIAIVGANALRDASWWKRIVSGALASLLYLVAAYYAEGAFKEVLMGLLLLALVVQLEGTRRDYGRGLRVWWRLVPAAILTAAMFYVYGYQSLPWLILMLPIWLVAEVVMARLHPRRWKARIRDLAPVVGVGLLALVILLVPVIERNVRLYQVFGTSPSGTGAIATTNVGNLAGQLPLVEALGIWNNTDFRFVPGNPFHAGELAAFALAILILGVVVMVRRRELLLPAALLACGLVAWRAAGTSSPYVAAKALVIAGPVVGVAGARGLLYPLPRADVWTRLLRFGALIAFLIFAFHSSYDALRNEPVWPNESPKELLALDRITRGGKVLDLVNTDYAEWLFNDSYMSSIADNTINLAQASPRAGKPFVYGQASDFDSIADQTLATFDWAVTSNTLYASQAPSGYQLVRRLGMYELWHRVGSVVPRQVLEAPGFPGAVLNCRSKRGRTISQSHGVAAVMTPPIVKPVSNLGAGTTLRVAMKLPAGRWQLSLQYTSAVTIHISGAGAHWSMPAYLDRPGPWFAVGTIDSSGAPIVLTLHADRPASFTGPSLGALTTGLAAVKLPDSRQLIPLSQACGRYVDWYRATPAHP